jgi:group II intron reverse transcriptase/maturase
VSLSTPTKIRDLRNKLYEAAKRNPERRFHVLYDKILRADILSHAYAICRSNGGAPGVDGVTFDQIEAQGRERFLEELGMELKEHRYRPNAVRRVHIPKPGQPGKTRPLGIPTVKDRTVQAAAVLLLEPIFEADLPPEQHAYRSGKSAQEAVREVHRHLRAGRTEVVDADLSGYFDSIPHAELMKSVARRICDRHVLCLVKMWLEAPAEEIDEKGRKKRTRANRDEHRGTPQGGVISPLLANLYMRRFLLAWKMRGLEQRLDSRIVNYADDFVILCRRGAAEALAHTRDLMGRLRLTLNETKTRLCCVPEDSFTFLGYTFGRAYAVGGRPYVGAWPSTKTLMRTREALRHLTRTNAPIPDETMVKQLNQKLRGWANYFSYGTLSKAYRTVGIAVRTRLQRWLCRKHKKRGLGVKQYPAGYLYGTLGLLDIERLLASQRRAAHATL